MPVADAARVLPEIREADAPDHIRVIYEDIRRWSAVPMVALIFRNLATHPGALEEVWDSIGPLFRNGLVQEAQSRDASFASLSEPD